MKLLIVGATGKTGLQLVNQALDKNHQVTACVRSPEKLQLQHENLQVKKGNIFDKNELSEIMKGHDAVVSCLGFPRNPQPVTGFLDSHIALTEAMRTNDINRFITMTSWYTDISTSDDAGFAVRWMLIPFLKPVLEGKLKMEQYLKSHCQDIDYTVVRPPQLGNDKRTGDPMQVTEEAYKVDTGTTSNKTSRADVAAFMLSCLDTGMYKKKMIAIVTNPK